MTVIIRNNLKIKGIRAFSKGVQGYFCDIQRPYLGLWSIFFDFFVISRIQFFRYTVYKISVELSD